MKPGVSGIPVRGRIDELGRLAEADPPLRRLQQRCGGLDGGPVAVPQLATIARLARRLGIIVSRGLIVADGEDDLELWVRAEPDGDEVSLAIADWVPRPARGPARASDAAREHDFLRAGADWLWEADEALRLTSLSGNAAAAIGEVAAALVGAPVTRLFHFVEADRGTLPILEALSERRRFDDQLAFVRDVPNQRYRLAAVPVTDDAGAFRGFRGTAALAPENVEAAAPWPTQAHVPPGFGDRLERALREPLDRIVSVAERIRAQHDGPLNTRYAGYAGDIATAARHLLEMIDDLVDLSAIESLDFQPRIEPIDLAEMAAAAAGLLSVRAIAHDVTIERPPDGEHAPALGDYRRVLQILVNLVGNAVRYAPEGSTITLTAARDSTRSVVIVADQGKGIAPEDHERIFERFERVDPAEPGGAGLGLYIARRLARAMGGDITLSSAPGEGARFSLTLPTRD
jgi:signal transduction histidine kinase